MISRSDWEPLPKPTLSPFARGYLSLCRFFTATVWCVPALRVPLVHSLINHFRQNRVHQVKTRFWRRSKSHRPKKPKSVTLGRKPSKSTLSGAR